MMVYWSIGFKNKLITFTRRISMHKLNITPLTLETFRPFGSFANLINPSTVKIGTEPVEFYRDMARLDLGQNTAASFSTCRVTTRPLIVTDLEYHTYCGEGILPLDGDILQPVAPATANGDLPWDRIEVFRVPKGTIVTLNAGVWHCGPYAYQSEVANVLIVLPERVYANDCKVVAIPEEKRSEM
jgi:ureidoglycolate lyase